MSPLQKVPKGRKTTGRGVRSTLLSDEYEKSMNGRRKQDIQKMEIKANKLWPEDYELFASMEGHYTSENEKTFFEKVRYKMEFELAPSNDLLLSEIDNEEQIYLVRVDYDEFIVGHGTVGHYDEECHVMNLSEALNTNLKERGYLDRDITLLDWLHERDYQGIRYNHNYAYM